MVTNDGPAVAAGSDGGSLGGVAIGAAVGADGCGTGLSGVSQAEIVNTHRAASTGLASGVFLSDGIETRIGGARYI